MEAGPGSDTAFAGPATTDGGKHWIQIRNGAPTIQFRDLVIQARENDLVCGTFGRGFFVLDDYTPLRHLTPEGLAKDAVLCPPRKTLHYNEATVQSTVFYGLILLLVLFVMPGGFSGLVHRGRLALQRARSR